MIKEYILKGIRYFIYIAGCLLISIGVYAIGVVISRFSFAKDSVGENVISAILMTASMLIGLFVLTKGFAYKEGTFSVKAVIVPMAVAFALQLIYGAILQFAVYTSGPAYAVGAIIYRSAGNTAGAIPGGYIFPFMFVFDVLYAAAAICGEYIGAKKRQSERDKLHASSEKH